jgi:aminopeptidase N
MDMMAVADPDAVHTVRNFIKKELALQLKDDLLAAVSGTNHCILYPFLAYFDVLHYHCFL